jgi:hypothetical protein
VSDGPSKQNTPFIHRHPWIILIIIFAILIGAWTTMIVIASRNRPEKVPLENLDAIPQSTPDFPANSNSPPND